MNKINIFTSCLIGFSTVISQAEDFVTDFTQKEIETIGSHIQMGDKKEINKYLLNLFKGKYDTEHED